VDDRGQSGGEGKGGSVGTNADFLFFLGLGVHGGGGLSFFQTYDVEQGGSKKSLFGRMSLMHDPPYSIIHF